MALHIDHLAHSNVELAEIWRLGFSFLGRRLLLLLLFATFIGFLIATSLILSRLLWSSLDFFLLLFLNYDLFCLCLRLCLSCRLGLLLCSVLFGLFGEVHPVVIFLLDSFIVRLQLLLALFGSSNTHSNLRKGQHALEMPIQVVE